MSVQLNWHTPLDAQASEIARYSRGLLPVLARHAGICAVLDDDGGVAPTGWFECEPDATAPGRDPLPVYHIGNNPVHLPIYEQSLREPGLVVLHDLSLVDLARHLSHRAEQPDLWKELMFRQYGDEIRPLVNRSEHSVAHYNEMVANYPLFQPFVAGAIGVVAHSRWATEAVRRQSADTLPVCHLALPGAAPPQDRREHRDDGLLRCVFCGHVGPNRRLLEFLEAWAGLPARERIRLALYGNINSSRQLMEYAVHFGLAEYVDVRGYVSDAELDDALQSADFALNLRWPTMGEASASQLRYWAAALPTLVSDVGWYGEQPDDTLCKIPVTDEIPRIAHLLQDALDRPGRYREIGQWGREHLRRHHAVEEYAVRLAAFAAQLAGQRLAWRTLDQGLVGIIAALCDSDAQVRLFRDAIETAVATLAAQDITTGETAHR